MEAIVGRQSIDALESGGGSDDVLEVVHFADIGLTNVLKSECERKTGWLEAGDIKSVKKDGSECKECCLDDEAGC